MIKQPETFAWIDYAICASKEHNLLLYYSTERCDVTLYGGYYGQVSWDNLFEIKKYAGIKEAFDDIKKNKALTCKKFDTFLREEPCCETCRNYQTSNCYCFNK